MPEPHGDLNGDEGAPGYARGTKFLPGAPKQIGPRRVTAGHPVSRLVAQANPNAIICRRRPCRADLRKWPALYRFPARDGQSPTTCKVDARSAHSTGLKTRSKTGRAPLNLVGGYRFPNATEIEADLAGYIRAIEACLLRDERVVELPTVESPPLISPDPFDIPSFLDRRVTSASAPKRRGWDD